MDEVEINIDKDIVCTVCGEGKFDIRDGFYYCMECGTKQEQLRHILINCDNEIYTENRKFSKVHKINTVKSEKERLSSWECYNYILHGIVEDLLALGAKSELKLMTLQVWAVYLRRMEAAFFNKHNVDFPRLNIRYLQNDAVTIYNTKVKLKKKRRRESSVSLSSHKEWRIKTRKLDEYNYSMHSAASSPSIYSSMSSNSMGSKQLQFNCKARKIIKKKKLSLKFLSDPELNSDNKQPYAKDLQRREYNFTVLNMKQIYCILAISLNLVEDDIQLCDFLRFIQEDSIGYKNVVKYFPKDMSKQVYDLLKDIDFHKYPLKYSEKFLRDHINIFCKNVGIKKFKKPNMVKLVKRYIEELCLPVDFAFFVERLINILPPNFNVRATGIYPAYEARAMAYIIFVLKLLFGLDGHKERKMSMAAENLNAKIRHFNRCDVENELTLFVWNNWVNYIEMRKVIISYFNANFRKFNKQEKSTSQLLQQMCDDMQVQYEKDIALDLHKIKKQQNIENVKTIFESILSQFESNKMSHNIEFKPTLLPYTSYFKTIINYLNSMEISDRNSIDLKIPSYMFIDHTLCNIKPFVEVKHFRQYFDRKGYKLKIEQLPINADRSYVGVFHAPIPNLKGLGQRLLRAEKANFFVSENAWKKIISKKTITCTDDLEFKKELEDYNEKYRSSKKRKRCKKNETVVNYVTFSNDLTNSNLDAKIHMEKNNIMPQRFYNINLFDGLSDEEYILNEEIMNETNNTTTNSINSEKDKVNTCGTKILPFYISQMDCWILTGYISTLTKPQRKQLQDKMPRSFSWLLETCANILGVDWSEIYEQLQVIELMFGMGINDLNDFKDCIHLKYNNPIKDFNMLINAFREIW